MLKLMLIHQKDNKGIVKSNFVTSCLALGAQSQQTPTNAKNILGTIERFHSTVTSPLYTISQ